MDCTTSTLLVLLFCLLPSPVRVSPCPRGEEPQKDGAGGCIGKDWPMKDEGVKMKELEMTDKEMMDEDGYQDPSSCGAIVDFGFLLDSSGSIRRYYQEEKDFLKALTAAFGISERRSHVGVITFSHIVEHSIKLKDHYDISSFNKAVDAIPLIGRVTRIDLALRLAEKELFTEANGARSTTRKILIVLTDGVQTKSWGYEDPALVADDLRRMGITVIVVGMGGGVNKEELNKIARGEAYTESFRRLLSDEFVGKLIGDTCKVAQAPPPEPTMEVKTGRCKTLSKESCADYGGLWGLPVKSVVNNKKLFTQGCYHNVKSKALYFNPQQEAAPCTSLRVCICSRPVPLTCRVSVDVGFLLDSSGSVGRDYAKEQQFLKAFAASFGISEEGSHVGVIAFNDKAKHSIKMNQFTDASSLNEAVDAIPWMDGTTRIDRALELAQEEMFAEVNGGRGGSVKKILVVITDGSQTHVAGSTDPTVITDAMRASGVEIVVVGVGSQVNRSQLDNMAGGDGRSYAVVSFDQLINEQFIEKIAGQTCSKVTS